MGNDKWAYTIPDAAKKCFEFFGIYFGMTRVGEYEWENNNRNSGLDGTFHAMRLFQIGEADAFTLEFDEIDENDKIRTDVIFNNAYGYKIIDLLLDTITGGCNNG